MRKLRDSCLIYLGYLCRMEKTSLSSGRGFHEELEVLAGLRRECGIVYRAVDGGKAVIRDRIEDLYEEEGKEWIRTRAGLVIGVEDLIEVNGMQNPVV